MGLFDWTALLLHTMAEDLSVYIAYEHLLVVCWGMFCSVSQLLC